VSWSFRIPPFVVAYRIQKERIVILAIYHGAQQWPEEFQAREVARL
jgi:plasmid stabilization system protein ParE